MTVQTRSRSLPGQCGFDWDQPSPSPDPEPAPPRDSVRPTDSIPEPSPVAQEARDIPPVLVSKLPPAPASGPARVAQGDCLDLLAAMDADSVDLVYIDPPFFSGMIHRPRNKVIDPTQVDPRYDSVAGYMGWIRPRIEAFRRVLKPTGAMILDSDASANSAFGAMMADVFGAENLRGRIVWRRASIDPARNRTPQGRHLDALHYFAKSPDHRSALRLDHASLWEATRTSLIDGEPSGHPTQRPLALAERIIAGTTLPGGTVLDGFCGSGTTLVAALRLGRRVVGFDESPGAITFATRRIAEAASSWTDAAPAPQE